MTIPEWKTRADFEAWWKVHVIELNRLAVTDHREYTRLADQIAGNLARIPEAA